MKRLFASFGFAALVAAVSPFGCAQGVEVPPIEDLDGGGTVDAKHGDGASEGGDCPSTCTEGTPYCDRASRKCVACLPDHDTCPVTTYCQAQAGGGDKCAVGCKSSADERA